MAFRQRIKAKKKQRYVADSEGEEDDADLVTRVQRGPGQSGGSAKIAAAASKLSIGDDVEEEFIFKKKKRRPKVRGVTTKALDADGELAERTQYTAEEMAALQEATPGIPRHFKLERDGNAGIKVSGSFRAHASAGDNHASAMPDGLRDAHPHMPLPPPAVPASASFATAPTPHPAIQAGGLGVAGAPNGAEAGVNGVTNMGNGDGGDGSDGGDGGGGPHLPDADLIRRAKEKRLRLREAHIAPGYVVSDLPDFRDVRAYLRAEDAVRKGSDGEGGSDDEPDEAMRVSFAVSGAGVASGGGDGGGGAAGPGREQEPREAAGRVARGSGAAEEEEMVGGSESEGEGDFARAQMRRALGHSASAARTRQRASAVATTGAAAPAAERGAHALTAIQALVARMRERRAALTGALQRTRAQIRAALAAIGEHEGALEGAGVRYTLLQRLRAYIRDLSECLAHKAADVEAMEEARLREMADRAGGERAAREEVLTEVLAAGRAAAAALAAGADPEAAAVVAEADALQAAYPEELDDLGRDANVTRRAAAEARSRARAAALTALAPRLAADVDGTVVADTAALLEAASGGLGAETGPSAAGSDADGYRRRCAALADVADAALADAAEEFASLPAVLRTLREAKGACLEQYRQAYIAEALPAIVAVYVRLQLMHWDPLFGGGGSGEPDSSGAAAAVEEHAWFTDLLDFSGAVECDPDEEAVPSVIAQVVARGTFLPMLRQAWHPADGRAAAVAATLDMLLAYATPATQQHHFAVVDAVRGALSEAVGAVEVPPWPPALQRASPRVAAAATASWQHAHTVLAAVCGFKGKLSQELLWELAGERLLSGCMLPAIAVAVAEARHGSTAAVAVAASLLASIVAIVPSEWLGAEGAAWQLVKRMGLEVVTRSTRLPCSQAAADHVRAIKAGLRI